ncbi:MULTISPECIES: WhiB family transcriptional regulator [Saccharopolyspora]|uniref:Transcriptional regulator WhiB n=1 Tax=Saccharopolyspora gregorii TaxID=33914 RepID=A0ABP6RW65_9PSEU|nr:MULTISPECIES: WhiB family transcriptional regulator [Saccharopolyspora]MCA1185212.1 WhiB family transcriptional regulator [Saccharopolyspora sp. 6T]
MIKIIDAITAPTGAADWYQSALCAQSDPDAFFPEKGQSGKMAKRICGSCEVREECLRYALGNADLSGIWGGLSESERRELRVAARAAELAADAA